MRHVLALFLLALLASPAQASDRVLINPEPNGDLKIKANVGGTAQDAVTVTGSTGAVTLGATTGAIDTVHVFRSNAQTDIQIIAGATKRSRIQLLPAGSSSGPFITSVAANDDEVTGSTANDLLFRLNSKSVLFSVDNGATVAGKLASTGAWTLGTLGTGTLTHNILSNGTLNVGTNITGIPGNFATYLNLGATGGLGNLSANRTANYRFGVTDGDINGYDLRIDQIDSNAVIQTVGRISRQTGGWTFGTNSTTVESQHILQVALTSSNGGVAQVQNLSTNSASDDNPVLDLRKGSTTATNAAVYIRSYANNGSTNHGGIRWNGSNALEFIVVSDVTLKENISAMGDGSLAKILQLQPKNYDFITGAKGLKGYIAQDVETVFPEYIGTFDGKKTIDGSMVGINVHLVKAIQELKALNDALAARIATLEAAP